MSEIYFHVKYDEGKPLIGQNFPEIHLSFYNLSLSANIARKEQYFIGQ